MLGTAFFYHTMDLIVMGVKELFDKLREPVRIMVSNPPYVLFNNTAQDVQYLIAYITVLLVAWGFLFLYLAFAFLYIYEE